MTVCLAVITLSLLTLGGVQGQGFVFPDQVQDDEVQGPRLAESLQADPSPSSNRFDSKIA